LGHAGRVKHAPCLCRFGLVRVAFVVLGFMVGATFALGANYERGQVIPEVKLKNGTVLHEFKVIGIGATAVVARWAGGQGSIALTQLPQEMQAALAPAAPPKPAVASAPTQQAVAGAPSVEVPADIRLTNGFVMHRSVVTHWDEDAVVVSYQGGIVPVQLKNIVPEQRAIFEARKPEALARQAKLAAAQAVATNESSQLGQARQEREALQIEEAEQRAAAINRGVAERYLVKGMTKEQARQAYAGRGRGEDNRNSSILIYGDQGVDKYGNSADRTLFFDQNGILTDWTDQRGNELEGAVQRSQLDDGLHGPPH